MAFGHSEKGTWCVWRKGVEPFSLLPGTGQFLTNGICFGLNLVKQADVEKVLKAVDTIGNYSK